eukprot:CAMPEP_0172057884 /NCGR_PEP_ID=MMETSP1043-20130122/6556_1 /TAXON_ID=464988 /ORGANISM="Hemiselmis andersenii, Strain CCMP441" /LENGTH=87 /DNA_ID=CAMNT_0012717387 /DNA_START=2362 /DNA_END=2625 /DNA_ORIENTATION=+
MPPAALWNAPPRELLGVASIGDTATHGDDAIKNPRVAEGWDPRACPVPIPPETDTVPSAVTLGASIFSCLAFLRLTRRAEEGGFREE